MEFIQAVSATERYSSTAPVVGFSEASPLRLIVAVAVVKMPPTSR